MKIQIPKDIDSKQKTWIYSDLLLYENTGFLQKTIQLKFLLHSLLSQLFYFATNDKIYFSGMFGKRNPWL